MGPNFRRVKCRQLDMKIAVPGILWTYKVQEWVAICQFVDTFPTELRINHLYSNCILKLREDLGHSLDIAKSKWHRNQILCFEYCSVAWMTDQDGQL